jgi:hypothetical protein
MRILSGVVSVVTFAAYAFSAPHATPHLGATTASNSASRATPWAIVLSGPLLRNRVVLGDWNENHKVMSAASTPILVGSQTLRDRPKISVSMFWGPDWEFLRRHPESLATLDTGRATQRGVFYPAYRERAALLVLDAVFGSAGHTSVMTADGLAILKRHGVPTRVD